LRGTTSAEAYIDSMEDVISFTKVRLPNGWLGNMSPYPVRHGDRLYPTVEHLFQALRFGNAMDMHDAIILQRSPMAAKMLARSHDSKMVIQRCGPQDLDNMRLCLRLKLEQHPLLVSWLEDTGGRRIIEDVTSRAHRGAALFWGAALTFTGWKGENWLGRLWMEQRFRSKRYRELGIDPSNSNPDGSDFHLMGVVEEELKEELGR
jgi:predicted NAD-dependent protein-ADP-ribosyltransferase YbiA (DUF1768 family)